MLGAVMTAQDISVLWRAHRRLERRAEQQAAIAALGSAALRGTPTGVLTQEAARLVEATLNADIGAVLPYTAAGGLEVRSMSGMPMPPPTGLAPSDPNEIQEFMRFADEPLLIGDLALGDLRAPVLEAQGMVSMAIAAIGPIHDRYGLLGAASRTACAFSPDDLAFLEAVANVLADAIERERSAEEALYREAQLNEAQRLAGVGSWEIDMSTGVYTISDHLRDMLGLAVTVTDAATLLTCIHVDDRPTLAQVMEGAIAHGHVPPVEFRIVSATGVVRILRTNGAGDRHDDEGPPRLLRGTVQDVTDQREAQRALQRSEERFRTGFDTSPIGMTLIEAGTGRFLRVNAAYARFVARTPDELLALTYADVVHPDDLTLPGRAEFVDGQTDVLVAEGRYLRPDGSTVWGSINASAVRGPDGSVDVLFSQVEDITDRRAEEEATGRELDQVAWVKEIHAALAEDRFELHAQPIVDLATMEVVQQELLLRMRSPAGDLIAPGEFLPAAERYGTIREIDRWVVARGIEFAAGGMKVEINLSGVSMGDPALIEEIDRALERTGADPSHLVFEITETSAIEEVDTARRLAERLRARGCRFALDDFGTGFAGISSLKALPLDYLKIDREFVRDLCTSETDRHVIDATLTLARAFGLKTIAEGVEDQPTLEVLRGLGVDFAQGYLLGRPTPIETIPR